MTKLNQKNHKHAARATHWGWLLPILALSPLSLAAKGCGNSGVVGDDCPDQASCAPGGEAGASGNGEPAGNGEVCGGLLGTQCAAGTFCAFAAETMCGSGDQTGVCTADPQICPDLYAPVCGCDGRDYSSDCEANGHGTSVATRGVCDPATGGGSGDACGGIQGLTCSGEEYCSFPSATHCGSGDQTGSCAAKPQACDLILAPVCGCDGNSYDNDCMAAMAGTSVDYAGMCGTAPPGSCGGRGGGMCEAGQYCLYTPAAMCGRADAPGMCTDIPKGAACDAVYDPVCGCDGKTYGNDCEAYVKGTSVDHTGACDGNPSGETCGGITGAGCDAGLFCNFPNGSACGAGDVTGACEVIPEICNDIADPVCGCDGNNYGNSCEANAQGTSVASKGKCK